MGIPILPAPPTMDFTSKALLCCKAVAKGYGSRLLDGRSIETDFEQQIGPGWNPHTALQFLAGKNFMAEAEDRGHVSTPGHFNPAWLEVSRLARVLRYMVSLNSAGDPNSFIGDTCIAFSDRITQEGARAARIDENR